jgi:hypothetical protein
LIVPIILKDVYQWHIPAGACQEAPAGNLARSEAGER